MIKTIEHAAKVQIRREEAKGKRDVAAAVKRYLKRANRNSSCLRIEMAVMGVHS